MKKIKLILILFLGFVLVGCSADTTEIFRFTTHEIEISVGEESILSLIYGQYSKDSDVNFVLSKSGIVELEDNVVTGIAVGEVVVTATINNQKTAKLKVRVIQENIVALRIISETNYFSEPGSIQLTVWISPDDISNEVIWSIETDLDDEENVVSINQEGLLTVTDTSEPKKIIVVAKSVFDPKVDCKKAFYLKYLPTESISIQTENGLTSMVSGGTITIVVNASPETSLEGYTIETNKPNILSVQEGNVLRAVTGLTKAEIVVVSVTSWDGVKAYIRIEVKK